MRTPPLGTAAHHSSVDTLVAASTVIASEDAKARSIGITIDDVLKQCNDEPDPVVAAAPLPVPAAPGGRGKRRRTVDSKSPVLPPAMSASADQPSMSIATSASPAPAPPAGVSSVPHSIVQSVPAPSPTPTVFFSAAPLHLQAQALQAAGAHATGPQLASILSTGTPLLQISQLAPSSGQFFILPSSLNPGAPPTLLAAASAPQPTPVATVIPKLPTISIGQQVTASVAHAVATAAASAANSDAANAISLSTLRLAAPNTTFPLSLPSLASVQQLTAPSPQLAAWAAAMVGGQLPHAQPLFPMGPPLAPLQATQQLLVPQTAAAVLHSPVASSPAANLAAAAVNKYPVVWNGFMALKNDLMSVRMLFMSGNMSLVRTVLPTSDAGSAAGASSSNTLRISQRMRLEQAQLDAVSRRMQSQLDYCVLLCLASGANLADSEELLSRQIIAYLREKNAAGIINVLFSEPNAPAETPSQPSYVIHIFPPCDFSYQVLSRDVDGLFLDIVRNALSTKHLLIVITSCL